MALKKEQLKYLCEVLSSGNGTHAVRIARSALNALVGSDNVGPCLAWVLKNAEIEVYSTGTGWTKTSHPEWRPGGKYRIKPTPCEEIAQAASEGARAAARVFVDAEVAKRLEGMLNGLTERLDAHRRALDQHDAAFANQRQQIDELDKGVTLLLRDRVEREQMAATFSDVQRAAKKKPAKKPAKK